MREVVIVSAARTALGSFRGSLASVPAVELGAVAIRAALSRGGVDAGMVEEVVMGNVLQAGLGQNPARQAAVKAGIPVEIPAWTVNKVCGSGLKAVAEAALAIRAGEARCVVAGGMENMSQASYVLPSARWGGRMGDVKLVDEMIRDGLWDAFNDYHMGITAENVAARYHLSREELDAHAVLSQQRAAAALESGVFDEEIVPVHVEQKKKSFDFARDEFPRPGTTMDVLGKLRPAFKKDGVVTAGNASGVNDGAAALVLMDAGLAAERGLSPLARIVGWASAGVEPDVMGLGPIPATRKALEKAGWTVADLDQIEANEAFAAQCVACQRELGIPLEKLNVNGGGISLGHPVGATGVRIIISLMYELRRRGQKYGVATLCAGGGMGTAVLIECL